MKTIVIISSIMLLFLGACKPTTYLGNFGQVNQTQVVLSNANFNVLGSFKGIATEKKMKLSVKNKEGLISQAKADLLANAKAQGVEMTGARTLTHVCVDVIANAKSVTATVSAEIIEFVK